MLLRRNILVADVLDGLGRGLEALAPILADVDEIVETLMVSLSGSSLLIP
jgi:hypothetical protein